MSTIIDKNNRQKNSVDPTYFFPDKSSDRKATAIEVEEVQYFSKLFGTETLRISGTRMARSSLSFIRARAMQLMGILCLTFLPR